MTETLVIHQGYDSPVQARVTVPDDPGYSSSTPRDWFVLDMMGSEAEQPVNVNTAMTFSAVFGCVRYISQTLASLGWHVYDRKNDREKVVIEDDTAWLLGMQASDEMNAFEWRQVKLKDALTWGNGYSEIERDGYGRVYSMYRLDPWRVCPDRDSRGRLIYEVANGSGVKNTILDPPDVFHLKALGDDGLVGFSMIEMARRTIELGMQQGRFGQSFFRRGPMPGGILKMTGHVKEEERKAARKSFEDSYGGAKKAGKVVVVSGGMDFTPLSMPNQDAQWLESRSFEVEEICRFYGVPPHKVAKLDRSTNNNIEHQSIEAVQDCLLPWARRLESEADVKLFGRKMRGRRFTRLNLKALLRGDSKTQAENITQLVNGGVMMVNEGRELLDLNPADGGDVLLVQGAMITLERAIEGDPEPTPAPEPAPTDPPADDTTMRKIAGELFRPIADAITSDVIDAIASDPRCMGPAGQQGPAGQPGRDGRDGKDGKDGKDGVDGKNGADGKDGLQGRPGAQGPRGQEGKEGRPGPDGMIITVPHKVKIEEVREAFISLLTGAYERMLRIEQERAKRQHESGNLRNWLYREYADSNRAFYESTINPILVGLKYAHLPKLKVEEIANELAKDHMATSRREFEEKGIDAIKDWGDRPSVQAKKHLEMIWGAKL